MRAHADIDTCMDFQIGTYCLFVKTKCTCTVYVIIVEGELITMFLLRTRTYSLILSLAYALAKKLTKGTLKPD
jgi:hypothetical protein